MNQEQLLHALRDQKIINSHSHHLPDGDHAVLNLQRVMEHSYVGWCAPSVPAGKDRREVESWLNAVRTRSYFISMERALMDIYDIPERIRFETWDLYDCAIRKAHADPDWHIRLLKQCNYEAIFLDAFWKPGDDNGHADLFRPAMRVNSFFFGYDRQAKDHNGNNAQLFYGLNTRDLDEYTAFLDAELRRRHDAGLPLIKCALAYDRGLCFGRATRDQARRAMQPNPSADDIAAFQNYLFHHICEQSAAINMPMQIHTGLGLMDNSRAMGLQSVIAAHPNTRFILMHGSYPWMADILGLTHVFPNVWADLCWLGLISTAAAHRFLHELIDVCNADRIVWGCDTWTSEESYGARSTFLNLFSHVLAERIQYGLMDDSDALRLSRNVLHDNAQTLL